jgi:hypothetical protein
MRCAEVNTLFITGYILNWLILLLLALYYQDIKAGEPVPGITGFLTDTFQVSQKFLFPRGLYLIVCPL